MSGTKVLSLDIFDTLLTRACGRPEELFLWLGRQLSTAGSIPVTAEVFARARIRAEATVWHREGGMDSHVQLSTIYTELVRTLEMDPCAVVDLVAAELALERRVSRPVPAGRHLVQLAVTSPAITLALTSDTYLSGEQVASLLDDHGLRPAGTPLLVSADRQAAKASGRLFTAVLDLAGGAEGTVLHVGDNPHADVDVPRAMGIAAVWQSAGRLNRYERLLAQDAFATGGLSAALAGASRQARLAAPIHGDRDRAITDVAAGVAAPLLIGYVLWVLRTAERRSLDKLAFLARDGQVLAAVARRLAQRLGLDLEITYLEVSRQSTNLAATFSVTAEETDWVFRDIAHLSVAQLLARFDLTLAELADVPALAGCLPSSGDAPAAGTFAEALRRQLICRGPVRDVVRTKAAARRALVTAYLDQEGLVGNKATGIVDFGGMGSQIRAVHSLVTRAGGVSPKAFLVGLDDPAAAGLALPQPDPAWVTDTETWLYDHRRGGGIRRPRGFGTCMQMFCAADHGSVTGYRRIADGRVAAEYTVERDQAVLDWGLLTMRQTVDAVVDALVLDQDLLDQGADLRDTTIRLVELFWTAPSRGEAGAWGAFPFEGAQATDTRPRALARRYTTPEVVRGLVDGGFPDLGWQHWYEGSLQLSAPPIRGGLRAAEAAFLALSRSDGPVTSRLAGWARARRR